MIKPKVITKAFGLLIKKRRLSLKISQEKLADLSNLDRTYISGLERGVRNPSLAAIHKLAKGFNITLSELFKNIEKEI
jgi:transcriptional regulator with XRE-family HTH domain